MRRTFLLLAFLACAFGCAAQAGHLGGFFCDCHIRSNNEDGIPGKILNDTLFVMRPIEVYDSNKLRQYTEWHIKSLKGGYYGNNQALNGVEREYLPAGLTAIYVWASLYRRADIDSIAKTFKHGFIDDWGWSTNSVNGIKFRFSYMNTNKKTIKYIDIYFNIKNDVGDICPILYTDNNIGHYRCTGPVEYGFPGVWDWDDNVQYYTSGDASYLHFTKIILTFMDNTKYTLIKEIAYKDYIDFK